MTTIAVTVPPTQGSPNAPGAASPEPDIHLNPSAPPAPPDALAAPASGDARRIASAILEVLAGMRSITDAALALGVTPARYYALEARAVGGLIAACEPRGPGPGAGAGLPAELDRLRAERDRLKAEAARYQTLARISQGAFALPALPVVGSDGLARSGATGAAQRSARQVASGPAAAAGGAPEETPSDGARPALGGTGA